MSKAEEIAQILGVNSTDVIVTGNEARLRDRELTNEEKQSIAHLFGTETERALRAIADLIENAGDLSVEGNRANLANQIREL